jgi:hypothetical protein
MQGKFPDIAVVCIHGDKLMPTATIERKGEKLKGPGSRQLKGTH